MCTQRTVAGKRADSFCSLLDDLAMMAKTLIDPHVGPAVRVVRRPTALRRKALELPVICLGWTQWLFRCENLSY